MLIMVYDLNISLGSFSSPKKMPQEKQDQLVSAHMEAQFIERGVNISVFLSPS